MFAVIYGENDKEQHWWINNPKPNIDLKTITEVYADGHELDAVERLEAVKNVVIGEGYGQSFYGDLAQRIFKEL